MKRSITYVVPLLGLLAVIPNSKAAVITLEGNSLVFSYDSLNITNIGNIGVNGDQLILSPLLSSLSVNSETFDGYSPPPYQAVESFSALIDVQAKPGYRIDSHLITATAYLFQEDNTASASYDLSFPHSVTHGLHPNNVRSETATSFSTGPVSSLSLAGGLGISANSHYLYDAPGPIIQVPVYGYQNVEEIVGYTPVYDEFGNIIDQTPIYEYRQVEYLIGYNDVETFFPVYKISAASVSLSNLTVDFQVSAVPLPATVWLFLSGLVITASSKWRTR